MIDRKTVAAQLKHTLDSVDFPALGTKISGKVRDSYVIGDRRVLITSDRLSAFDRVLTTIPFKGQLLNGMASHWFEKTSHIIPNHLLDIPHPNMWIAKEVEILPVEVIVRGYLTGSAWRDYQAGKAISGIELPKGMKKSQRFDIPLLTPSTKAERGQHDEPISSAEIVSTGLVEKKLWDQVCQTALELFAFGSEEAAKQNLILVDTKYEFGLLKDQSGKQQLVIADEIHTQDSSRYWMLDSYDGRFQTGEEPVMLDKEFVRGWLIERGYMGDGQPPEFDDDIRIDTSMKYIEAYEKITGQNFVAKSGSPKEEISRIVQEMFG